MRDPYRRPLDVDRAAIAAYNAGVERARDAYTQKRDRERRADAATEKETP